MSESEQPPLESVGKWSGILLGRFVAHSLVFGFLVAVASLPVIFFLPKVSPLATDFGWLAIVGIFLPFLNPTLDDEDAQIIETLVEKVQGTSRFEKLLYFSSFLVILVGSLSALVFVTSIVAATVTEAGGSAVFGLTVAVFLPYTDIWVGNAVGWNIASTGGLISLVVLSIAALAYRTNPMIPRRAAMDARSVLQSY